MARDKGLEELVRTTLSGTRALTEKAMFGGLAWLYRGHLLCGARTDGMLVRLGRGNDGWALEIAGVVPMLMRERRMQGWVRAGPDVYGDDELRRRLVDAALAFVQTLPSKEKG